MVEPIPPDDATILNLRRDLALQLSRAAGRLGLTQAAVAKLWGIPQPTLSKIINGVTDRLSIELLLRIAVRADVALTLLIGDDPSQAGVFLSNRDRRSAGECTSPLADGARRSVESSHRRLNPAQRVAAFLEHSQLLGDLQASGRKAARSRAEEARPRR